MTDLIQSFQIFTANDLSGNDAVIYNVLKNATRGRYFRFTPLEYEMGKCFRLELFGERGIT